MRPGIQISSFKPLMQTARDMYETFLHVRALGCRYVQLQWISPSVPTDTVAQALREAGLVSVSVQDFFDSVRADREYYLRLNEQTGGRWLCVSRIPDRMKSPEGLESYMRELEELSETANSRGQEVCLHPVAADYREIGGLCPVDEILARMPKTKLCLDLYHLYKAGFAIPAWIERYRGRIVMVHFKDEKNGRQVPAGRGDIRYDGAVRACIRANVSYGFAEQESWDGDPFARLGEALDWLRGELSAAER